MTDRELDGLIMAVLGPLLAPVSLARNYQQVVQGAATQPWVWFVKVSDHRHGHAYRSNVWDEGASRMVHTESQVVETTYQFTASVPAASTLYAADLLQDVAGLVQSDGFLTALRAAGVGVQRVTDVSNPYLQNDQDRFESVPTFDIVLTHQRSRVVEGNVLQSIELGIYRS